MSIILNQNQNKPVLCIIGPTASGKTALACELLDFIKNNSNFSSNSKYKSIAIISVDSAMIYKTMDIGTAKPNLTELKKYPHSLINLKDPAEVYSVAEFLKDLKLAIDQAHLNHQLPVCVGGTMMYFNAFLNGLSEMPEQNEKIRNNILNQSKQMGWEGLYQKWYEIDPIGAAKSHSSDQQRILRALEVYELTQKPISSFWGAKKSLSQNYNTQLVFLGCPDESRFKLHERIQNRIDQMFNEGLEAEILKLWERGDLDLSKPSIRCVGYRQFWQYFLGELDKSDVKDKILFATRQLAKRQITWMRKLMAQKDLVLNSSDILRINFDQSDILSCVLDWLVKKNLLN